MLGSLPWVCCENMSGWGLQTHYFAVTKVLVEFVVHSALQSVQGPRVGAPALNLKQSRALPGPAGGQPVSQLSAGGARDARGALHARVHAAPARQPPAPALAGALTRVCCASTTT